MKNTFIDRKKDRNAILIRQLLPWHANLSKRLIKSPKIYLRDSGVFHALQSIHTISELKNHPKIGASWEGFAMEELISILDKGDNEVFFYAAHSGVEVDLYWQDRGKNMAAEFKYMDAHRTTRSMHQAIEDLQLDALWVVYPGDRKYRLTEKIYVIPLERTGELNSL